MIANKDGGETAPIAGRFARRLSTASAVHLGSSLAKSVDAASAWLVEDQHPDGYYPTPPRGVHALLTRESFKGVLWECACGDGAISRILEAAGFEVLEVEKNSHAFRFQARNRQHVCR